MTTWEDRQRDEAWNAKMDALDLAKESLLPKLRKYQLTVAGDGYFYRGFSVYYDPKPIPARMGVDWTWYPKGDGGEHARYSGSLQDAMDEIDQEILERE